jgi:S-adenosylmethionine-diacylgycerolhomoserine-N-methlytransferase
VFISYSLSMIPDWQACVREALSALKPGGSLHIVDFGGQERLPGWFRSLLRAWLAKFHVSPRDSLREVLESESRRVGASLEFETLFRGYTVHAVMRKG